MMKSVRLLQLLLIVAALAGTGCGTHEQQSLNAGIADTLRTKAVTELWNNFRIQPKIVKAHAAEFIWWLGMDTTGEVYRTVLQEEAQYGQETKYRMPIWRILVQTERDPTKKQRWIEKLLTAFRDTSAPDRIGAAESLAKLKISPLQYAEEATVKILEGPKNFGYAFTLWGASLPYQKGPDNKDTLKNSSHPETGLTAISELLKPGNDRYAQAIAAYSMRQLGGLTPAQWSHLATHAAAEPMDDPYKTYLLSGAFVTAPEDSLTTVTYKRINDLFLRSVSSSSKDARMELAAALAKKGTAAHISLLEDLLYNKYPLEVSEPDKADIRSAASYALLSLDRRLTGQSDKKSQ